MFVLNDKIQVGDLSFSGVNEVRIKRSIHSYIDSATIKIPSVCNVRTRDGKSKYSLHTASQFREGDAVSINLGYGGEYAEEFRGFVKHIWPNTELEIECEGYVRRLRYKKIKNQYITSSTAKELLLMATEGTGIRLECPDNIPIGQEQLINMTGADICELIKKRTLGMATLFFKEPDVLWCGLVYTAVKTNALTAKGLSQGDVQYRIGYNVLRDSDLKLREPAEQTEVIMNGLLPEKEKVFSNSQLKNAAATLRKTLVHIPTKEWIQKIANEYEYKKNYTGYEGRINGFLYPICFPGYTAYVKDENNPGRAGSYIVESTELRYGAGGAWRSAELGPLVGFDI